jgi:hypothetical protein
MVLFRFIILKLPYQVRQIVLNATLNSKKAHSPTAGFLMENSIVYPAVNLNTSNSSQLQLIKKFILVPAILSPIEQQIL